MYTAFAAGNVSALEGQVCPGLLGSLRARIAQRAPNTSLRWTVHKYLSRPRLVSYKAALMPGLKKSASEKTEKNGFVQAVVRIHSLQSLQHVKRVNVRLAGGKQVETREVLIDAQGRELPEEEQQQQDNGKVPRNAKESVEYFVIQKALRRSKEGPWMVWGSAEETTLDKIRAPGKKSQLEMPKADA